MGGAIFHVDTAFCLSSTSNPEKMKLFLILGALVALTVAEEITKEEGVLVLTEKISNKPSPKTNSSWLNFMLHGVDIVKHWLLNMLKLLDNWPKKTPPSNWVRLTPPKKVPWPKNSRSEVILPSNSSRMENPWNTTEDVPLIPLSLGLRRKPAHQL